MARQLGLHFEVWIENEEGDFLDIVEPRVDTDRYMAFRTAGQLEAWLLKKLGAKWRDYAADVREKADRLLAQEKLSWPDCAAQKGAGQLQEELVS